MEVLTDSLDELLLDQFSATLDLNLIGKLLVDVVLVLAEHEIWNLTGVQDVVDVFEEGLIEDLRICHGESDLFTHDS